jgi:hypothetical protein
LGTLLSDELEKDVKKKVLSEEYHIKMTEETENEVREMCNLSEGVFEKGEAKKAREVAIKSIEKGFDNETIAEITGLSIAEVEELRCAELTKS